MVILLSENFHMSFYCCVHSTSTAGEVCEVVMVEKAINPVFGFYRFSLRGLGKRMFLKHILYVMEKQYPLS